MVVGGALVFSSLAVASRVSVQHHAAECKLIKVEKSFKEQILKLVQEVAKKVWYLTNRALHSLVIVYNDHSEPVTAKAGYNFFGSSQDNIVLAPGDWAFLQTQAWSEGALVVLELVTSDGKLSTFSGKKEHLELVGVKSMLAAIKSSK